MKTSAEIYQETISKLSDAEKTAIFPPITRKNFVVRKNWYGRNQVITFTNKKGKVITYNHDLAYDLYVPFIKEKAAWLKYGYWSQSTDLPLILRHQELMKKPAKKVTKK